MLSAQRNVLLDGFHSTRLSYLVKGYHSQSDTLSARPPTPQILKIVGLSSPLYFRLSFSYSHIMTPPDFKIGPMIFLL